MITRRRMGYGGAQMPLTNGAQPMRRRMGEMGQMGSGNPAALQPSPLPTGGSNLSKDPGATLNPMNADALTAAPDMAGDDLMELLKKMMGPQVDTANPAVEQMLAAMRGEIKRKPKVSTSETYDLPGVQGVS